MRSINKKIQGEELFVGIDLHKRRWHVTIRTFDVEIFSSSISGRWEHLHRILILHPQSGWAQVAPQRGAFVLGKPPWG